MNYRGSRNYIYRLLWNLLQQYCARTECSTQLYCTTFHSRI